MAVAWDDTTATQAEAAQALGQEFGAWTAAGNPPVCAHCGATDFELDDGITRFKTLDEAQLHLQEHETLQLIARLAILGDPERN